MATVGVKGLVFPASQAVFTLIRVQVRVLVSLHWLASIALYFKQCYITWILRYARRNKDVIIDVRTFWRPFLVLSCRKRQNIHKNCSYFK